MESIHVGRTLSVLMLGTFIAILNQTLINIALPHLMTDFNMSAATAQWLSTAYMLVNGVLIPITAFLIATYGTKSLFLAAMAFFTVGSVLCAVAPVFSILLFGRVLQAVGAGILIPLVMNIFLILFPPERRGAAMGTMGIAMIFAPAIGPTLAGWIVENYTWRILFIMMIPLGIIDILLALFWLKNVSKPTFPKFDSWGAITSTLGFGGLLYGFSEAGNKGWSSLEVMVCLIIGVIFIALFTWRELIIKQPLLDLRVFRYNIFTLTTIIGAAINMTMYGGMILLPIYLQSIRGFTPLQAGLLMLPGALLMGVMSPISGALFDRIGARPLVIIGLLITIVTTWEFSKLTSESTYNHILLLYTTRSFGMSFMMMSVQTAGLNQVPLKLSSHATAMSNTIRQIAGSIGTALLVTVMTSRTTIHLGDYTNTVTTSNPEMVYSFQQLFQSLMSITGLSQPASQMLTVQLIYQKAMLESTIKGINDAFMVATLFALVALLFSFFITRPKKENAETEELNNTPTEHNEPIGLEPIKP